MANELLTPRVAGAFIAISAGVLALAARGTQARLDPARVPLMGVLGAFVFAAQMINFPILPGTSGHLGGGILLAILLGPHAATLVMASILIVQCLIFQDGGLLALGTNILNMGIIPTYVGYALFNVIAGRSPGTNRLYVAVFLSTIIGMTAGAAMVPVQSALSGVLAVPLAKFLLVMIGLHLIIALAEALITFGVVAYVVRVRPQLLESRFATGSVASGRVGFPGVIASLLIVALLLGGVGSLFASSFPDALDSVTGGHPARSLVRTNEDPTITQTTHLQEKSAPLPEYSIRGHNAWWGTSLSGVLGTVVTLVVVWIIGRALRRPRPAPEVSELT